MPINTNKVLIGGLVSGVCLESVAETLAFGPSARRREETIRINRGDDHGQHLGRAVQTRLKMRTGGAEAMGEFLIPYI